MKSKEACILGQTFEFGFKSLLFFKDPESLIKVFTSWESNWKKDFLAPMGKAVNLEKHISGDLEKIKRYFLIDLKKHFRENRNVTGIANMFLNGMLSAAFISKEDGLVNRRLYWGTGLGGESGYYENADVLMFSPENKELFVYELALGKGGLSYHYYLYNGNLEVLNFNSKEKEVGAEINYYETDFIKFAKKLITFLENCDKKLFKTEEIDKTVQAITYALSFLNLYSEEVERVTLRVVFPFYESVVLSKMQIPKNYREEAGELWKRARYLYDEYKAAKRDTKEAKIFFAKKSLEFSKGKTIKITPAVLIDEVRKNVKSLVFQAKPWTLSFLLHPPGTGKTTAVLSLAESFDKCCIIHFSPRRSIVADKRKSLEERGFLIIEDRKVFNTGKSIAAVHRKPEEKGRLKLVLERFKRGFLKKKSNKVAITTTTQALIEIRDFNFNTAKHLIEIIDTYLSEKKDGKVIVVVDELTGAENSVPALKDIINYCLLFKKEKEKEKKISPEIYFFGLDANLFTIEVVDKVFSYLNSGDGEYLPEMVVTARGDSYTKTFKLSEEASKYFGVETFVASEPTFPTKDFITLEVVTISQKEYQSGLFVDFLIKKLKRKFYLYVQNKLFAGRLALEFWKRGYKVALVTSTRKISKGNGYRDYDVVISTSSLNRGIDIEFSQMVAVVPFFGIEVQMAEILQAFARIRKRRETENKKILLVAVENAVEDELFSYLERIREEKIVKFALQAFEFMVCPDKDKEYFVPVPPIVSRTTSGIEANKLKTLLGYMNEKSEEIKKVLQLKKVKDVPFIKFNYSKLSRKSPQIKFPYVLYRARGHFEIPPEIVDAVLEVLERDEYIEKIRKEELSQWLRTFKSSRSFYSYNDLMWALEWIPILAYRKRIKKGYSGIVSLESQVIGRKGYETIRGDYVLKDGRFIIPVLEVLPIPPDRTVPKIPVELLPL